MKKNMKLLLISLIILSILAFMVYADVLFKSPTACAGQWTNCANANADGVNTSTASVTGTTNKSGRWNSYGFSFGNGDIIQNVTVRADFFANVSNGFINVRVSGNNGKSYGKSHIVGGNTAEQSYYIDVTNDIPWNSSALSTNLRVNATCFKSGSGLNPTCNLDWIPVNVTFTPFDFSLSANPSSDTVVQGNNITTNVTITLLSGNSQTVSLSSIGCPINASCSFNPASGTPTYTSEFKVNTNPNGTFITPTGTYNITLRGLGDGKLRSVDYILTVI